MSYTEKLKFKQALYQFLIDHSRLQPDGYFRVLFYFKTAEELNKRIDARASGKFKRYNIEEKEHGSKQLQKEFSYMRWQKRRNRFITYRIREIESGDLWNRLLLFLYRKTRDKLFGKLNKNIQ